jgi:hypothetical protein
MQARRVDPRDALTEETYPEYHVTFWERLWAPADIPLSRVGWRSDDWSLVGATSVFEVLAWADAHRAHTVSVFTLERSLIRLAGTDPTDPGSWAGWPDPEPD